MVVRKILLLLVLTVSVRGSAQPGFDTTAALLNLKAASQNMVALLATKDFAAFTKYIHPAIIKLAGGEEKMAELTRKSFQELEGQGYSVKDVAVRVPGKIILEKDQLQSVILQELTIRLKNGTLVGKSYMVAVSYDKGKHWFFADTGGKELWQMQAVLPDLSSQLVIPAKEAPVFTPDQ